MIRVLHVLNNLGSGGAESFLMNIYRKIDREAVQFDFLIRSDQNGDIVDEIAAMGGKVYRIADFPKHAWTNKKELRAFFKQHGEYKIVHMHANALIYMWPIIEAKNADIPCRIVHSHNTKTANIPLLMQIHSWNRKRVQKYATDCFACSDLAGEWMFKKCPYEIIQNGVDIGKFEFSEAKRAEIRKKHHVGDSFVIGNVGRMTMQKNHDFMIKLFAKFESLHPASKLMLVGEGERLEEIKTLAKELGVLDKVIFTGVVHNVEDYLAAMDVFLMPSFYEGFPVAYIEAQAMGVPCVVSDRITESATIQDNCKRLSLNAPIERWITAIEKVKRIKPDLEKMKTLDSEYVAKELEHFYLEHM